MKKVILSLLAAVVLFGISPVHADECLQLGWGGGAAGSNFKWVRASASERGETITVNYNWKNGSMTGRLQNDGSFRGTWIQDGSNGGQFQFRVPKGNGEITGWWSSNADNNSKRYPLKLRLCN